MAAISKPYCVGGTGKSYKPIVWYKKDDGTVVYLEKYVSHISISRALDKNPICMRHAGGTCTITFRNVTQQLIDATFIYGREMCVSIKGQTRIFTGYVDSYTSTHNPKYSTYDVEVQLQDLLLKMAEVRKTQRTDANSLTGKEAFQWIANAMGVSLVQDNVTKEKDMKIIGPLLKEGTLVEYCDVYAATQVGGWCITKNGTLRYMKKNFVQFGPTVEELGVPYDNQHVQTTDIDIKDMPYLRRYGVDTTKIYTKWQRENREAEQTPRENYLKGTKYFRNWTMSNFTIDSTGWAQGAADVTGSRYLFAGRDEMRIPISSIRDKTMTFSIWAHWYDSYENPTGVLRIRPRIYATKSTSTISSYCDIWLDLTKKQDRTPIGQRLSTTFKVNEALFTQGENPAVIPDDAYFALIIYYRSPNGITLAKPKLEIGSTPTPWIEHKDDAGYVAPKEEGGVWHSSTVTSPVYEERRIAAYGNKLIKVETALDTRGMTYDYNGTWGYFNLTDQYNIDGESVKEQTLVPYSLKGNIPLDEKAMKQAVFADLGMSCPWRAQQKPVWPNIIGIKHDITPFEMRTTFTYG